MISFKAPLLACLVTTLTACSTFAPKTDVERVEARSQERLNLLMDGKVDKAYGYMTPGYRAANPVARFRADFAAGTSRFIDAKVTESSCEEDACSVTTLITYNHVSSVSSKPFPVERVTKERWIKLDNQWWFIRLN